MDTIPFMSAHVPSPFPSWVLLQSPLHFLAFPFSSLGGFGGWLPSPRPLPCVLERGYIKARVADSFLVGCLCRTGCCTRPERAWSCHPDSVISSVYRYGFMFGSSQIELGDTFKLIGAHPASPAIACEVSIGFRWPLSVSGGNMGVPQNTDPKIRDSLLIYF